MNLPQPDSGPDSNINSPYCTVQFIVYRWLDVGTRTSNSKNFVCLSKATNIATTKNDLTQ
jgi:hypothetical protein